MMCPVVLPANGFATAETFTAVQKVLARRAQVEFAALRVLHTVVSPDRETQWSYPVKRDSKNDVSLTTYRHSADKHLEKSLARRVRDVFVKKKLAMAENCHMTRGVFESVHGFKLLLRGLCTTPARR